MYLQNHQESMSDFFPFSSFFMFVKVVKKTGLVTFPKPVFGPLFFTILDFLMFLNFVPGCVYDFVILAGTGQKVFRNGPKMAQKWPFFGFLGPPKSRFCMVFMVFHGFGTTPQNPGFSGILGHLGSGRVRMVKRCDLCSRLIGLF